jgi:hypothetical protein
MLPRHAKEISEGTLRAILRSGCIDSDSFLEA